MEVLNLSRRKALSLLGGAISGFYLGIGTAQAHEGEAASSIGVLSPLLRIDNEGQVYLYLPKAEMGQGVTTGLAILVAEELSIAPESIRLELAPLKMNLKHPGVRRQSTGGSSSLRTLFLPLRYLGAAARDSLLKVAADSWQLAPSSCYMKNGTIYGPKNRQTTFKALAPRLAEIKNIGTPRLKAAKEWGAIGRFNKRIDTLAKCDGSTKFSIDAVTAGAFTYAAIKSFPFAENERIISGIELAKQVDGVKKVLVWGRSLAVLADKYWNAQLALNKITVEAKNPQQHISWNTQDLKASYKKKIQEAREVYQHEYPPEDAGGQQSIIRKEFMAPFLAHAAMEPLSCSVAIGDSDCHLWLGTQTPERVMALVQKTLKLPENRIHIYQHYIGGAFGRRLETEFVLQALECAKLARTPLKVVWTRENDFKNDHYRPASYCQIEVGLTNNKLSSWKQTIVCPSIKWSKNPEAGTPWQDPSSTGACTPLDYFIPQQSVHFLPLKSPLPLGYWRAVAHSQNGFFVESMINFISRKLQQDPFSLREELLAKNPRLSRCLKKVKELSAWKGPKFENTYRGVAAQYSFKSYAAQVVEIKKIDSKSYSLSKVFCVVDCGIAVDPVGIKRQIESAIVYGLSAAIKQEITCQKGEVEQGNFHEYSCLNLAETPTIISEIIAEQDPMGGIGEVALPPAAPALGGALSLAFSRDFDDLPFKQSQIRLV